MWAEAPLSIIQGPGVIWGDDREISEKAECATMLGSNISINCRCGSQGLPRFIGVPMERVANDFKAGGFLMSIFPTLCAFSTVARTESVIDLFVVPGLSAGVKKYGDVRLLINCEDVNDVKSEMVVVGFEGQRNQRRPQEGGCSDTIIKSIHTGENLIYAW
ncbi:Hypothetical predicted protein [Olea europaea subsp. europaea]|uniref:Uncharacterized protein n=1 Tax=Olea europaea subsp. europaea TaxID=158383 RepID=A0A8S0RQ51_OLEEU|nr:Hypothetical predicted protein [Olea europaea subsp. europaea]